MYYQFISQLLSGIFFPHSSNDFFKKIIFLDLDPSDLSISLWLNGERKQNSRTSKMIFNIPAIIGEKMLHYVDILFLFNSSLFFYFFFFLCFFIFEFYIIFLFFIYFPSFIYPSEFVPGFHSQGGGHYSNWHA